jgi:hypothetical protein
MYTISGKEREMSNTSTAGAYLDPQLMSPSMVIKSTFRAEILITNRTDKLPFNGDVII